jgi:threonine dehydratase
MKAGVIKIAEGAVQARQRIEQFVYQTPLLYSRELGKLYGSDLRFKAENFQHTGSFKMRGAASKMTSLTDKQGLITASSGNHGIACARAASIAGLDLVVVLPENVAAAKLKKIESYGVEVVLHGAESNLAEAHAQSLSVSRGLLYVSPYNDDAVIAGQGTIGLELLEQTDRIDNIFISMGGGGLISGVASVLKHANPNINVYGVSAKNSAALAASMVAGKVVITDHYDTLADGVAGGVDDDSVTLALATAVIDEVLTCSEDDIVFALQKLAFDEHLLVEGSAALALSGFIQVAEKVVDQNNIVLLCGGNFDNDKVMAAIKP